MHSIWHETRGEWSDVLYVGDAALGVPFATRINMTAQMAGMNAKHAKATKEEKE